MVGFLSEDGRTDKIIVERLNDLAFVDEAKLLERGLIIGFDQERFANVILHKQG